MTRIDEEWLSEALRDLGRAIEVPSDGPDRVLAARGTPRAARGRTSVGAGGRPKGGSRPTWRRQLVVVGVTLAIVAIPVVALVLRRSATTTGTPTSPSVLGHLQATGGAQSLTAPLGSSDKSAAPRGQAGLATSEGSASGSGSAGSPAPAPAPTVATKVIKTGTVDLQVARGTLPPAVDQLTSLAGGLGGYVADTTTSEVGPSPTADMTLRVPATEFETLLARTQGLGKATSVTTSGQDVTSAYVDLNAQIQALEDTRTQYLQIMAKATSIGDVLSVEQQLSDVQTQLDQLQGQQMVLADQTSFGTLTVHLSQFGSSLAPTPPHGLAKAWDRARSGFADGVEGVIGASGSVLVFLVCAGLLLLAGRLAWPAIRRRLV